ncbi:hypothetical protein [Corynebacterium sp. H130]|uniref:hypothetical protein n=1 Tax=Corynebacterium sp. H130 TaxID=3133444 RepID=UPI0030B165FE
MIRETLAGLSCLVIAGALVWASFDHSEVAPRVRGDQVGMEAGESFATYRDRAAASVADSSGTSFALVTLSVSGDVSALDQLDVKRVCAAVSLNHAPVPLPEPVGVDKRSDVIHRWTDAAVTSVVVYDDAEALQALSTAPGIAAVEVLPPDAIWGRFGIRPVKVD